MQPSFPAIPPPELSSVVEELSKNEVAPPLWPKEPLFVPPSPTVIE